MSENGALPHADESTRHAWVSSAESMDDMAHGEAEADGEEVIHEEHVSIYSGNSGSM